MQRIGALLLPMFLKMIRAVLDTNIFISALFWRGIPYHVVKKGLEGNFHILVSQGILEEVGEKLYQKFKFPVEDTRTFLEVITVDSYLVEPEEKVRIVKDDPSDNKIIECALAGRAHFIVSGDKHLLKIKEYKNIRIITPRQFFKFL